MHDSDPVDWRRVKRAAGRAGDAPIEAPPAAPGAAIVPFPAKARGAFIARLVAQVAARSPLVGEKHLAHQLRVQGEALRRKGVPEPAVRREVAALEAAVRTELWRAVFGQPSPRGRA
jgi:hypothetical protein